MSITVSTHARISVSPQTSFENIREVIAEGTGFRPESGLQEKLCSSYLQCQKGTRSQAAVQCLQCPRLVNFVPQDQSVRIRCLWTSDDPVGAVMTLESEFISVSSATTISKAKRVAKRHGVRHLLLIDQESLTGVLSLSDLVADAMPEDTVSERANHCPWTIAPQSTLEQAATLMRDRQVGMLPVIEGRKLVGIVTRGDLRRAGVPASLLGDSQCAA